MKTLRCVALGCLIAAPVAAQTSGGSMFAFYDAAASHCLSGPVPCFGTASIYVFAILHGPSAAGITGAEYSIQVGLDASADGWLFNETFDGAATVIGTGALNPVDPLARGVNVVWPSCQSGSGNLVLVETVTAINYECNPIALPLTVVKRSTPSNPFFQCPLFTLCDAPVYTKVCIGRNLTTCPNPEPPFPNNATCSTGNPSYLNTGPTFPDRCQLAVETTSWSQVKRLYQHE